MEELEFRVSFVMQQVISFFYRNVCPDHLGSPSTMKHSNIQTYSFLLLLTSLSHSHFASTYSVCVCLCVENLELGCYHDAFVFCVPPTRFTSFSIRALSSLNSSSVLLVRVFRFITLFIHSRNVLCIEIKQTLGG